MMMLCENDDAPDDVENDVAYHIDVVMVVMAGADDGDG